MRHVFPSLLLLTAAMPAFATIDSGLLALVPSGAKVISGVDVGRARTSPFGQYVLSTIKTENQDFQQMIQETGFDPRRDVQDVLFVSTGPTGDQSDPRYGILVRGNFDHERIRKSLLGKGATAQSYQGLEVLVDLSNHGHTAFAFPEVDIAVMGDLASVQQIIANRANPAALDPTLQQLVSSTGTNHDVWFASTGPGAFLASNFKQQSGQQMGPEALQSILQSSGGISFGDVVQLSVDAVTRSAKDATALVDVVRFGASMIQLQRQKDAGADIVASSIDNMTLQTDGSSVHMSVSIPENGLEQLSELKAQHRSGEAAKPTKPSVQ